MDVTQEETPSVELSEEQNLRQLRAYDDPYKAHVAARPVLLSSGRPEKADAVWFCVCRQRAATTVGIALNRG